MLTYIAILLCKYNLYANGVGNSSTFNYLCKRIKSKLGKLAFKLNNNHATNQNINYMAVDKSIIADQVLISI